MISHEAPLENDSQLRSLRDIQACEGDNHSAPCGSGDAQKIARAAREATEGGGGARAPAGHFSNVCFFRISIVSVGSTSTSSGLLPRSGPSSLIVAGMLRLRRTRRRLSW